MNLLKNLKIRTKLAILIALMMSCIIVVGIIGYVYNSQSKKYLTEIYYENLIPVQLLTDTMAQTRSNKADFLEITQTTSASVRAQLLNNIEQRKILVDKDLSDYEKSTLDHKEKQLYGTVLQKFTVWREVLNKALDFCKAGKTEEAYTLYEASGKKLFDEFQDSLKALEDYNIQLAKETYDQNTKDYQQGIQVMLAVIAAIILLCMALGMSIVLSITRPLRRMVTLIEKTARFDLEYDASFDSLLKCKDETGITIRSMRDMRAEISAMIKSVIAISGDLSSHSEELSASTEENTKTISQVVATINEIAQANGNQAEMVNEINATIIEVATTIGEVNAATAESAESATKSLEIVTEGQKAVDMTMERMQENVEISQEVGSSISELGEMIEKVGSIVGVITSIAEQTNLLALNAAIEAARAGELGRGFAVVSEEIRKLAEGSSTAAKEIFGIVKETTEKSKQVAERMNIASHAMSMQQEAVDSTKGAFDKIKASVEEIVSHAQESAEMLREVDAVTREIALQTEDMAAIAEQSAASTQEISASSEEQLASVEIIAQAAEELSAMADRLTNEMAKFKV